MARGDGSSATVGTVASATGGAVRVGLGALRSVHPSRTAAAATMKMIALMPATFGPCWNESVMRQTSGGHRENFAERNGVERGAGFFLPLLPWRRGGHIFS